MQKEEPTQVATVSGFMEWASQFNHGGYLFRGVTNQEYNISASAYRRLKNIRAGNENRRIAFEKFFQINRGLIRDVRPQDMDWKDGRKLRDLEILAGLQHYRAATCLIDFTYNALIALWFACGQDSTNATKCGKVVAVRTDQGPLFRDVTLELLEKDIDYFFLGNEGEIPQHLYKWQPPHQNSRIIAQQSVFLFGAAEIDPDQDCIIFGNSKKEIRESLKKVYGITEAMLFPDFEGFARQHNQNVRYTQLAASQYQERGHRKIEEGEYEEAIADYTEAIKIEPSESSNYQNRGAARETLLHESGATTLNEYRGVLADYTEAINLDPNAPVSYYQRGILIAKVGRTHEAVLDLEKALQIAEAVGHENYIADIQQTLHEIRQTARQSHSHIRRNTESD